MAPRPAGGGPSDAAAKPGPEARSRACWQPRR